MENGLRLREAQQVHAQIMTTGRLVGQALVEMAAQLKRMRDERLFEELGRESFEEYLKEDVGLGVRQAYNYISTYERLQPELLEKYSGAGITKLQLLCEVSAPERAAFAEGADLANISVAELEKLIAEKNGLHEQLRLFEADMALQAEELSQDAQARLEQMEKEIEALRGAPVEVQVREIVKEDPEAAARIRKLEEELTAEALRGKRRLEEAKAEANLQLQKEKAARKKAEADAEARAEAATQAAVAKAVQEEREKAEAASKAAIAEAEELKRKLAAGASMAGSRELAEFAVLMKKMQQDARRMREIIEGMTDAEQREKLEKAMEALKEAM